MDDEKRLEIQEDVKVEEIGGAYGIYQNKQ